MHGTNLSYNALQKTEVGVVTEFAELLLLLLYVRSTTNVIQKIAAANGEKCHGKLSKFLSRKLVAIHAHFFCNTHTGLSSGTTKKGK